MFYYSRRNKKINSNKINNQRIEILKNVNKILKINTSMSTQVTDDESVTGLGLITLREFVKKNGEKISVSSQEGKGNKFTIKIPVFKN